MKLQVISITGKATEQEVNDQLFAGKVNPVLMAQAVRVYLANQRSAKASAQTRSDVSRTKTKWYRQKGTGRARHGARTPNIFVGGGAAHGPTGNEQFKLRLTKSMRVAAMLSGLASKVGDSVVGSDLDKVKAQTKDAAKAMLQFAPKKERTLIVAHQGMENLLRATNNLPYVLVTQASRLNLYELLLAKKVVFTPEAIQILESRLLEQVVIATDATTPEVTTKSVEKKTAAKTVKPVKSEKAPAKTVAKKATVKPAEKPVKKETKKTEKKTTTKKAK